MVRWFGGMQKTKKHTPTMLGKDHCHHYHHVGFDDDLLPSGTEKNHTIHFIRGGHWIWYHSVDFDGVGDGVGDSC